VHGRSGIANDGKGAANRVHYGRKYANAFWNDGLLLHDLRRRRRRVIGPLVAMDVAGHEMSHGVMSRTAGLVYSGESGGLNEANSDIMGTMVEFRANSTLDTPDYMIGEEIFIANVSGSANQGALRYMFDPHRDGLSPNCWSASIGNIDVHYSSGPAQPLLLPAGRRQRRPHLQRRQHQAATCNGGSLAGIGRAKAEKILVPRRHVYMTSDTNYAGARARDHRGRGRPVWSRLRRTGGGSSRLVGRFRQLSTPHVAPRWGGLRAALFLPVSPASSPSRRARPTACLREPADSLANRFFRCHFTVSSLISIARAISLFDSRWRAASGCALPWA
jgi:hypothetical protein